MSIKDFIISNHLNDQVQQDAETEQTYANTQQMMSATRLNDTQSHRIMSLLPGEMQTQMLENVGIEKDNAGKDITNRGNEIINIINQHKITEQRLNNDKLEFQVKNLAADRELEIQKQQAEIALRRAQASQATADTQRIMQAKSAAERELLMQQYPKVAASMEFVTEMFEKGDIPGANAIYQSLLKSLPPEFLQFEGRQGMDLLGPTIDEKEDIGVMKMFTEYARQLVPKDSQMGAESIQAMANKAAVDAAVARGGGAGGVRDEKARQDLLNSELEGKKKAHDLVANEIASMITASNRKGSILDYRGKIADPVVATSINTLTKHARDAMSTPGGKDITSTLGLHFAPEKVDPSGIGGDNTRFTAIFPKAPKNKERFQKEINRLIAAGDKPKDAYQKTFEAYTQKLIRDIFSE